MSREVMRWEAYVSRLVGERSEAKVIWAKSELELHQEVARYRQLGFQVDDAWVVEMAQRGEEGKLAEIGRKEMALLERMGPTIGPREALELARVACTKELMATKGMTRRQAEYRAQELISFKKVKAIIAGAYAFDAEGSRPAAGTGTESPVSTIVPDDEEEIL